MGWKVEGADSLIPFPRLQALCRPGGPPPRPATVRRWCEAHGIRYKIDLDGGVWTTVEALNAALGLLSLGGDAFNPADLI
jgi:hypothetical protein